jgi:hypothetical protein
MTIPVPAELEALAREVRLHIFRQASETTEVPQAEAIARVLKREAAAIHEALRYLAAGKVLILAPHDGNIWAANPFCAVPSAFRVETRDKRYWGICIWDALGIVAALHQDALIRATCGDCGDELSLEVRQGKLSHSEGVVHFAIPAHHWWDNIGFT